MIKTVQIGDRDVQFSTSFAWAFAYRAQFGEDAAKVLLPVIRKMQDPKYTDRDYGFLLYEDLGFTGIADIAWAMARVLDKSIPEPSVWAASFGDDFSVTDLASELIPAAIESCFTTKNPPTPAKKTPARKKSPQT